MHNHCHACSLQLNANTRTVVESFGALLRYAKVTGPQNVTQEDFQVNLGWRTWFCAFGPCWCNVSYQETQQECARHDVLGRVARLKLPFGFCGKYDISSIGFLLTIPSARKATRHKLSPRTSSPRSEMIVDLHQYAVDCTRSHRNIPTMLGTN